VTENITNLEMDKVTVWAKTTNLLLTNRNQKLWLFLEGKKEDKEI